MFLDFDDHRPETPRVVPALTCLERVLLVIVGYQLMLLSYFLAPGSWTQPVDRHTVPDEPIRFVRIEPLIDHVALPRRPAPPSDLDRRAASPEPLPGNSEPTTEGDTPEKLIGSPADPSPVADTRPPPALSEIPAPLAPRVPGGIVGAARKTFDRYGHASTNNNPNGGVNEHGPAIQFDSRGADFGPWLRRFRAQVMRNWLIPQAAEVLRGHVVIQLRVLKDGTLANIRVIRSSGIDPFDRAAMTALKLSTPTLPLPAPYPLDAIDPFTVIFYYNEQIP